MTRLDLLVFHLLILLCRLVLFISKSICLSFAFLFGLKNRLSETVSCSPTHLDLHIILVSIHIELLDRSIELGTASFIVILGLLHLDIDTDVFFHQLVVFITNVVNTFLL